MWIQSVVEKLGVEVVAIDGKALKGSYDRKSQLKALHLVSAWSKEHRLVLGQTKVHAKSNEITAIPALLEMIYRGLYHFYVAHQKGQVTDPIKYFAAPENQDLGIVKRQRKPNVKLIVAPFPAKQRGTDQFFFQVSSKSLLTTVL